MSKTRPKWYTVWDHEIALEIRETACGIEARLPDDSGASGGGESFFVRSLEEAFVRGWQRMQTKEVHHGRRPG